MSLGGGKPSLAAAAAAAEREKLSETLLSGGVSGVAIEPTSSVDLQRDSDVG